MTTHIGTSPLTGRIFQGRVNKSGDAFTGEKMDVTGQVLKAVIDKAEYHGGTFDIEGAGRKWTVTVTDQAAIAAIVAIAPDATLDMVLHCPACHLQHIDRADEPSQMEGGQTSSIGWINPPHKSHLCIPKDGGCGHVWRPADVATNGVKAIQSTGKLDSPIA